MADPVAPLGHERALNADVLALVADSVICTDEVGRILVFNPAAEQAFGYSASEVMGKGVEMLLPLNQRTEHVRHVRDFGKGNGANSHLMGHSREVRGRRKNGDEFPAEAMVSRQTIDGMVILTVVHRDITERKELEELREAVARERDHRLNNLLAVVSSLVSITASNAVSVAEFRDSLVGRLRALSATQSAMRFGKQSTASLSELFLTELEQYRSSSGTNIVIDGPPVSVGGTAAQLLTLVLHELATNSAKYGALRDGNGRVNLKVDYIGNDADQLLIEWQETGGPPVQPPERKGFGTALIKQLVGKALRADVDIEYRPDGLICRMTLPKGILAI